MKPETTECTSLSLPDVSKSLVIGLRTFQSAMDIMSVLSSSPTTALKEEAGSTPNIALVTSTSLLSLFGTVFIIVTYFVWKDVQTTSRKILLFISVADFFTAAGTILGLWSGKYSSVCTVQSIVGTLSVLCSFFWTVFMAIYLYLAIAHKNMSTAQSLMPVFHVFGWGVPALVVIVAASTGSLGNNGDKVSSGWCWVNATMPWYKQVIWMIFAGKLWEILASIIISALYFMMREKIKKELSQEKRLLTESTVLTANRAEKKLMLIPLLFVVFRIWGTIRFIIFLAGGPNQKPTNYFWLMLLQAVGDNAQGFNNFLVYCFFTEKIWGSLRASCNMLCGAFACNCCCPAKEMECRGVLSANEGGGLINDVENDLESSDSYQHLPNPKEQTVNSYGSI